MYEYIHVPCRLGSLFKEPNHREIIKAYSEKGYRLVQILPLYHDFYDECEIIFEKKVGDTTRN